VQIPQLLRQLFSRSITWYMLCPISRIFVHTSPTYSSHLLPCTSRKVGSSRHVSIGAPVGAAERSGVCTHVPHASGQLAKRSARSSTLRKNTATRLRQSMSRKWAHESFCLVWKVGLSLQLEEGTTPSVLIDRTHSCRKDTVTNALRYILFLTLVHRFSYI